MSDLKSTLADIDRRSFLKLGAAGLGGMAVTNLQADETTLPVLKTQKAAPGAHRGYVWVS